MQRLAVLLSGCVLVALAAIAPSTAGAATFPQCPPISRDTGCQFLITVSNGAQTVTEDPTQTTYDVGGDDALIGIQNNSSVPISAIHLSAEDELFGFDGDGICNGGQAPVPTGCVVQPEVFTFAAEHEKSAKPGKACGYENEEKEGKKPLAETIEEGCGFNPPAGEPAGVSFPAGAAPVGLAANGDWISGYEGPTSWFTGIGALGSNATGAGTVNFSPAIPPGGSSYFGAESPPVGGFGSMTTLATTLSGGGQPPAASITVVQGTPVADTATLSGANAAIATGAVGYNVYSDPACTKLVTAAGAGALTGPTAAASTPEALPAGIYYWQASYAGDPNNKAATSTCGSEILTVQAPTTTTTTQTGGGVVGPSIPVLKGSSVTDLAHIAGAQAATATGAVTYTLYKEAKCKAVLATSVATVTGGVAGPSVAIKPKVGTYYWVASYSGGGLDAPSASPCGSEKLVVSLKANLGLPNGKKCFSKRAFRIHPQFPKGAKIVSYKEYINGKLAKEGKLSKRATSVSLIGLPKGAYKVELVTFTAGGTSYEDTRTFHTCVPKKHKHHH